MRHGGQGFNAVVEGRASAYSCGASGQNAIVLLGDFQTSGVTVVAEEATVAPAGQGYSLISSQRVPVREIVGD
jgi:hypothetical protein